MPNSLEYLTGSSHPEKPEADYLFLMFHGLGANGHDFADLPNILKLNPDKRIDFIFPHAPENPVTINGGMMMPSWYDIKSMDFEREIDEESLARSIELAVELVEDQLKNGLKLERLFIGGFSQGGAITTELARVLLEKYPNASLAGLVVLSSYLLKPEMICDTSSMKSIPIFWGHGNVDGVVPFPLGQRHAGLLEKSGFNLSWNEYAIGHSVAPKEFVDLNEWLNSLIK